MSSVARLYGVRSLRYLERLVERAEQRARFDRALNSRRTHCAHRDASYSTCKSKAAENYLQARPRKAIIVQDWIEEGTTAPPHRSLRSHAFYLLID